MASQRSDDTRRHGRRHGPLWSEVADRTSGVRAMPSRTATDTAEWVGGQYRLLGPIGESCYGRAIRAQHVASGRDVALHIIADGAASERALIRELPLVVAKCALLAHPHVVTLQAYGRVEAGAGPFYVVTDALEGVSLAEYLDTQGEISVATALLLARQIGRALRAAHKLDIVHGDLRPENVRVSATDDGLHVRVTGFGKLPSSRAGDEPVTGVRGLRAPTYAAPEQLTGELLWDHALDARVDVYALGAIMFRMLAGVPPFTGATAAAVAHSHRVAAIPSLRVVAGTSVSVELDEVVTRCLAKNPADRFPDVAAVMSAMRIMTVQDGDFLSRDASDPSALSPPALAGVNSILPTVSANLKVADAATRMAQDASHPRRLRVFGRVLGTLAGLAVAATVVYELLF